MNGYNITILTEKEENREDSFWYRGQEIAKSQLLNRNVLYIDCCGEIRVYFDEDGDMFRNEDAVEQARSLGLVDSDLSKIGWVNNNWFAIREFDINGEMIGDDWGICHTYDDALELLEEVSKQKMKEYYT